MSKNKLTRIGLQKALTITVAANNTFSVFGDSIGVPNASKSVYLKGTHHNWNNPPVSTGDVSAHELKITAYCHPRHANSDDDLTVTITVVDPVTGLPDTTTITFPDVQYSD